jgi:nucleotide-binding universal stress UspA family protein
MAPRLELRRLLVPLDGSTLSEAILPVAEGLTRAHVAELLLLRVLEGQRVRDHEVELEHDAQRYLEATAERLHGRGLRHVRRVLWHGEPEQAIVNAAVRERVQLVAMSTHGRSGLDRLRFGSVAEAVVRRAPVPVLLARGVAPWGEAGIRRILVPLDGSPASEAVLPMVAALAGPFDLGIDLLHVAEPGGAGPERADRPGPAKGPEPGAYLGRVAAGLETRGLRASTILRRGLPPEIIATVAAETGADLVAMSTHGRTGLGRLLVGSVAERVLRAVPVPVLLWKSPTESAEPGAPPR